MINYVGMTESLFFLKQAHQTSCIRKVEAKTSLGAEVVNNVVR